MAVIRPGVEPRRMMSWSELADQKLVPIFTP
jgi:hypothetical protein